MKYRRGFEIIADILKAAKNGARKTRIMYIANLSHSLLEKYLAKTIDIGFIILNNDCYEVTERGQLFLERFEQFFSRYSRVQRELEKMRFEMEVLERMCMIDNYGGSKVGVREEEAR